MPAVRIGGLATAFAVAALGAALVNSFVLQSRYLQLRPFWFAWVLGSVSLFAVAGAPPLLFLALTRRMGRRPVSFDVDEEEHTFTVPTSARHTGLTAVMSLVLAGFQFPAGRAANTDEVQLRTFPWIVAAGVTLITVLTCLGMGYAWLLRYSVTCTPCGLTVAMPLGRREVPWSALLPGGPRLTRRHAWSVGLLHRSPDGRCEPLTVPLLFLAVDQRFLVSVIRHYAEQPMHRAAIGTQGELERLETAYSRWAPDSPAHRLLEQPESAGMPPWERARTPEKRRRVT